MQASEDELLSSPDWHPVGPGGMDYGEVEHIYNFSVQKSGVAASSREKFRHLSICGCAEYLAVKKTVNHISYGTHQDKRKPHKNSCGSIRLLYQFPQIKDDESNKDNSKEAQGQFSNRAAKLHSKSHSVVLYKANLKPVAEYRYTLPYCHIQLYGKLYHLINYKQQVKNRSTSNLFQVSGSLPLLICQIFVEVSGKYMSEEVKFLI